MEKWKRRAVDLLTSVTFGGREDLSVVPYCAQKVRVGLGERPQFPKSYPEKHGISSRRIYTMLCELERELRANMHSIMIICGGEIISECSVKGYDTVSWHVSHSMAKTVVGMVIGSLIDDGLLSLDTPLVEIFPEIEYRDKKFSMITIEHLLTMTSCVDFAEAGSVTENEWTSAFFSSSVRFLPGTRFAYNSMNSYILARVVERSGGRGFGELAERRIFAPLGIKDYLWEKSPEGYEKGGWGLYMSPQSWAKLGLMMLRGGIYSEKRILSREWVVKSTTTQVKTPEEIGGFNYGYHIWTARESDEFLFNGMLGQNVWICPKNDLVVVMTGGNQEIFQDSPALEIVRKYLGGRISDNLDRRNYSLLRQKEMRFFSSRAWVRPKRKNKVFSYRIGVFGLFSNKNPWDEVVGCYAFGDNNIGMMPLTLQIMQNNLRSQTEMVCIKRHSDSLILAYRESGEEYALRVGLGAYEDNVLQCRGESYLVRAMGEAIRNGNSGIEYRIELIFAETASVRRLKIKKSTRDRVEISFFELPDHRLVENLIASFSKNNSILSLAVDLIERRFGEGVVKKKIESRFNPTLIGADTSIDGFDAIITEQNKLVSEESTSLKILRAVVARFFKER